MTNIEKQLLILIQVALGHEAPKEIENLNWDELRILAIKQGVAPIVCDALVKYKNAGCFNERIDRKLIVSTLEQEQRFEKQEQVMHQLARFYGKHGIRMMVIKGWGLSRNFPVPKHRYCCDMDIYLFGDIEKADRLIEEKLNVKVDNSHHNHSVFRVNSVVIENHYDFVNVHSHRSSKMVDQWLKDHAQDAVEVDDVWLPSADFNALYVLFHAAAHFAAEQITLRHVLDWALLVENYHDEIDWNAHWAMIKKLNMDQFMMALNYICVYHLGFDEKRFKVDIDPKMAERVLGDILSPEYQGESKKGVLRYIYSRFRKWWANRWKHRMVYRESLLSTFIQQAWAHLQKPSSLMKK